MDPVTLPGVGIGIALCAAIIGFGRLIAALYPIYEKRINAAELNKQFKHGPFDEATINNATKFFIRPKCQNIDPAQEVELRHALSAAREDLIDKVDHFILHDESCKHLIILADSGTGKTTFMLNYFAYNNKKWKNKVDISIYPLGVQNADEWIDKIEKKENKVLFLDALDEDTKAIPDHKKRIQELMNLSKQFRKVIITCRTQFFPKDEEVPVETGIIKIGPCKAGESKCYYFKKIYISPFDDLEIRRYIYLIHPFIHFAKRKKCLKLALSIPNLAVRPMLLAHIPDIVEQNKLTDKTIDVYEAMIDAWFKREGAWIKYQDIQAISEILAIDMYINREVRKMERIPLSELESILNNVNISVPSWKISGRSLLNRDAFGNFKFAHRSIMEYFFVKGLVSANEKCYNTTLTDQMKDFLFEYLELKSTLPLELISHLKTLELSASRDQSCYLYALTRAAHRLSAYSKQSIEVAFFSQFPQKPSSRNFSATISTDIRLFGTIQNINDYDAEHLLDLLLITIIQPLLYIAKEQYNNQQAVLPERMKHTAKDTYDMMDKELTEFIWKYYDGDAYNIKATKKCYEMPDITMAIRTDKSLYFTVLDIMQLKKQLFDNSPRQYDPLFHMTFFPLTQYSINFHKTESGYKLYF